MQIYLHIYARTYLGVVGSLLRNKDNNCDAVKKVNGREHGKKRRETNTNTQREKKFSPKGKQQICWLAKLVRGLLAKSEKKKWKKVQKKLKKKIGKLNQQKYLFNSSKNSNNNNMSKGKPRGSQKLKTS